MLIGYDVLTYKLICAKSFYTSLSTIKIRFIDYDVVDDLRY